MLDIVFINEEVCKHYRFRGLALFDKIYDLLLVTERDLRIRNKDRRNQGMGCPTFFTAHPLDGETDKNRQNLCRADIMAIANQAAAFTTGAFCI